MDPRERADQALARAIAKSSRVVTPDNAVSPMDAQNTVQIPRAVMQNAIARSADPRTQQLGTHGQHPPTQPIGEPQTRPINVDQDTPPNGTPIAALFPDEQHPKPTGRPW